MTEIPAGSVVITPDKMWSAIEEVRDTSRRTEAGINELKMLVNPALAEVRGDLMRLDQREEKNQLEHEARIRVLEEQSWASRWVPAIVMSLLVSVIGAVAVAVVLQSLTT